MKNLLLKSILIVSSRERKSRKIEFDPKTNIIKGENDTGKSSLIKSIYSALGAQPHNVHHQWKNADAAVLLRFELDRTPYAIYRHRNSFSLFDKNNELLGTYNSVTKELGIILGELFDFNLKLNDRNGTTITPPPAYLYLPFYIDQDKGWIGTWGSFEKLGQIPHWKKPVINYHLGLRPDKWYEFDAKRKAAEEKQEEPRRQTKAIEKIISRTHKNLARVDFDIDVEQFKKEIDSLIGKCEELKLQEARYRQKITELETDKIRLEAQIEIVAKTHDELSADYRYALVSMDDSVNCPTCGTAHSNSFAERFAIAEDTETCDDLLASLKEDLAKTKKEIVTVRSSLEKNSTQKNEIDSLLESRKGKIILKDLVEIEGKKSLLSHLHTELKELEESIGESVIDADKYQREMKKYEDQARRKKIILSYRDSLHKNTNALSVLSLEEKVFKNPSSNITESGSDMPRAILAYFYTILEAIEKNGSATFFPIVIDAPNQQEQDNQNLERMLRFIKSNQPEGRQIIIGLVDDCGIDFGGKVICLNEKYSLLNKTNFDRDAQEMRHFSTLNLGLTKEN